MFQTQFCYYVPMLIDLAYQPTVVEPFNMIFFNHSYRQLAGVSDPSTLFRICAGKIAGAITNV